MCTYPRNAQHIIWIPDLGCDARCDKYKIYHGSVECPSSNHEDAPLYPPLEPLLLLPLSLNEVGMFGDKVGVYAGSCVLELWIRVNIWSRVHSKRCAPLLDLKNEIVVGTVTRVVTVRIKKGKNCPYRELDMSNHVSQVQRRTCSS
jgi:hypothetical protein